MMDIFGLPHVHCAEVAAEEEQQQHAQQEAPVNGAMVPDLEEFEMDPDEALSDEDAPDLQDEIAKTLTSLRVRMSLPNMHACVVPCPTTFYAHACITTGDDCCVCSCSCEHVLLCFMPDHLLLPWHCP